MNMKNNLITEKSQVTLLSLSPWFVTVFADGEACFTVSIQKNNTLKTGWLVRATFQIATHSRDRALLEIIQEYLGVGEIYDKKDVSDYRVSSLKEITNFFITHFD